MLCTPSNKLPLSQQYTSVLAKIHTVMCIGTDMNFCTEFDFRCDDIRISKSKDCLIIYFQNTAIIFGSKNKKCFLYHEGYFKVRNMYNFFKDLNDYYSDRYQKEKLYLAKSVSKKVVLASYKKGKRVRTRTV